MAHEALKFNVFSDNLDNWQPIVGAQDYGTFYMIYVRFLKLKEQQIKEEKGERIVYHYTAEFRLQNYNGEICIGFEGIPRLRELSNSQKLERQNKLKEIIIGFDLLTAEIQKEILEEHNVDFILEIDVKPFDTDNHIGPIKLQGVSKKFNNCVLETTAVRKSPDIDLYNSKDPLNSKYLNPYHYSRAGDEILEVGLRNSNSKESFNYIGNVGTPLSRCNPSRSFLI